MKISLRLLLTALIPSRLRLRLKFAWQRMCRRLDPELLFVIEQRWEKGTAVDIGANGGIYSYAFSKSFDRVEAFEPNGSAAENLQSWSSNKIVFHNVALSDHSGNATLYAPVSASGVEYSGWGSLHQEALPPTAKVRVYPIRTRTLDSYNFENVVFIKIDVEMHEKHVLTGAAETIERCRPAFLIEVKPPSRTPVWDFFTGRQYRCFFLERNRLCSVQLMADFAANSGENFFWLPAELAGLPLSSPAVQPITVHE